MAQHRLGRAEEAQQCLAKASAWMGEADRQKLDDQGDLGGRRSGWSDWTERIVVPLLCHETEALLKEGS
jgi:hypothetical protein